MSRRLDVINLGDPAQRRAPRMMSSCETSGCGGGAEPLIPPPPTFSEVRVNGVEISPVEAAADRGSTAPTASTITVLLCAGMPAGNNARMRCSGSLT